MEKGKDIKSALKDAIECIERLEQHGSSSANTVKNAVPPAVRTLRPFLPMQRSADTHTSLINTSRRPNNIEGNREEAVMLDFSAFYHPTSAKDKCTLYRDRNLIDRRNVSSDVKHHVNPCKTFLALAIKACVILSALHIMEMSSIDGKPAKVLPVNENGKRIEKSQYLVEIATKIVDEFVLRASKVNELIKKKENLESLQTDVSKNPHRRLKH
eukprot:gene5639-10863_t